MKIAADIILRPACLSDAENLLILKNHPEIKKQSHDQRIIKFDEHIKWMTDTLKDPGKSIWIIEKDEEFVGVIRDELVDSIHLLTYAIMPRFQGYGIGKQALKQRVQMLDKSYMVEIKKNNIASIKMVEYIGMKKVKEEGNILYYKKIIK